MQPFSELGVASSFSRAGLVLEYLYVALSDTEVDHCPSLSIVSQNIGGELLTVGVGDGVCLCSMIGLYIV